MYAIVKTGGKQYKVTEGDTLFIEKLASEAGERLAGLIREQFPVALIDEFQDTDPVQYQVFHRIYAEQGDLCFVGDPKQAIYAFRGADLATYLKARDEAARQYSLATNHRSTPELIAALNQLFDRPMPFAEPGLSYPPVGASDKVRAQLVLPVVEDEADAPLSLVWLDDDYLGKGAAGAAVQNLDLMLGLQPMLQPLLDGSTNPSSIPLPL